MSLVILNSYPFITREEKDWIPCSCYGNKFLFTQYQLTVRSVSDVIWINCRLLTVNYATIVLHCPRNSAFTMLKWPKRVKQLLILSFEFPNHSKPWEGHGGWFPLPMVGISAMGRLHLVELQCSQGYSVIDVTSKLLLWGNMKTYHSQV